MDKQDIISMAREAGFEELFKDSHDWVCFTEEIERFAALVLANNPPQSSMAWQEGYAAGAAAEREACAKVCITIANKPSNVVLGVALECADAIRARGNT